MAGRPSAPELRDRRKAVKATPAAVLKEAATGEMLIIGQVFGIIIATVRERAILGEYAK